MIPLHVLRGREPEDREKARDTWQWRILHEEPNRHQSPFDFKQDISTSLNSSGNAYIWKVKVLGEVIEGHILDPATARPVRNGAGQKMIRVTVNNEQRDYSPATVLHIRSWTMLPGADAGLSPIAYHRHALGSALGLKEYEARFFSNGAQPGGAISVEGDVDKETIDLYRDQWDENHRGLANAHRPAIFKNGAKWQQIGISLEDAQFIEANAFAVEEIARIFRISSPAMLGSYMNGEVPDVTDDFERFLKVDLAPELSRIEQAFRTDRDFFPASQDLFPEFLADAVMRPDVKTRYDAYRLARQGGWITANELRKLENLPPLDGGDELQQTPVGGAPNPSASSE
jgi:HK97 family phage portal protein